MRTPISVILLFAFSFSNSYSQFGLRGGLNVAFSHVENFGPDDEVNARVFPDLSLIGRTPITDQFFFHAELAYRGKGYSLDNNLDDSGLKLEYLEASFLALYEVEGEAAKPLLLAGPHVGYALAGSLNGAELDFDQDDIKRLDAGLSLGAGLKFPGRGSDFFVEVRYQHGLLNLSHGEDFVLKNRSLNLGLGIIFNSPHPSNELSEP